MMIHAFYGVITSVMAGIVTVLGVFPVITRWHSRRFTRIGVIFTSILLNMPGLFLFWRAANISNQLDHHRDQCCGSLGVFMSYCTSFLWYQVGIVAGYILHDELDQIRAKLRN